jgi:hypothetical protein
LRSNYRATRFAGILFKKTIHGSNYQVLTPNGHIYNTTY